jgi:hypothetical protein
LINEPHSFIFWRDRNQMVVFMFGLVLIRHKVVFIGLAEGKEAALKFIS